MSISSLSLPLTFHISLHEHVSCGMAVYQHGNKCKLRHWADGASAGNPVRAGGVAPAQVLCDNCPRAFHLGCLNMTEEDLPEGDWKCPK